MPPAYHVAMAEIVRAAGGVVRRQGDDGRLEVILVHRPKYDDWSMPKGKLAEGESFTDGALREVLEETGLRCRLGPFVGEASYHDRKRRPKVTRYWEMSPIEGRFVPTEEVDEARWLPVRAALELMSYDHDRRILRTLRDSRRNGDEGSDA